MLGDCPLWTAGFGISLSEEHQKKGFSDFAGDKPQKPAKW
jgi:hypothetical protein